MGAHAGAARLPAADPAHQAPAPGCSVPATVFLSRGGLQPHSAARRATRISASTPARTSRGSTPCRPTPASSAAAAPSTVRPTTPARCSTRRRSSWGCARYLNESAPRAKQPLLGKHISEEAAFQCTTCGACEYQCPVGIQHLPVIIGLRRGAVNTGQVGGRVRHQAVPEAGAQRQRARLRRRRAQKFIEKNAIADLRRHAGVLPVARLHGLLRSAGPRDRAGAGARAALPRRHLRRAAQGEVHGRSGAAPRQRPAVPAAGRGQYGAAPAAKVRKMVSICPHCVRTIGDGLEGVRRRSSTIEHHSELAGAPSARGCRPRPGRARRSSSTTPATWAAIATSTMSRAR